METIHDPPVPYLGKIPGRFVPGKIIRIQGATPAAAYKFRICLQCGPKIIPRDDVALQVTVRTLEGCIAFNSLQNGEWGNEQREVLGLCAIRYADKFEIKLTCDSHQYKIAINDYLHYHFPCRIPYNGITHLAIDGDVSVVQISYITSSTDVVDAASGSTTEASAPLALYPMETENNDIEMVNNTHVTRPPLDPLPPTYEEAMDGSRKVTVPSARASYPTERAPYPIADPPYPTRNPSHPTIDPPYPTEDPLPTTSFACAPYPTESAPYPIANPPYPTGNPSHPTRDSTYHIGDPPYPTGNPSHPTRDAPFSTRSAPSPASNPPYPTGNPSHPTRDSTYRTDSPSQPTRDSKYRVRNPPYPTRNPSHPTRDSPFTTESEPFLTVNPPYPIGNPSHPTRDPPYPTENPSHPTRDFTYPMRDPPYPTGNPSQARSDPPYPTEDPLLTTRQPPYPSRNTPYPSGDAPYPTGDASYPTRDVPYPTGDAPYPTGEPPYTNGATYPTESPYPKRPSGAGFDLIPGVPNQNGVLIMDPPMSRVLGIRPPSVRRERLSPRTDALRDTNASNVRRQPIIIGVIAISVIILMVIVAVSLSSQ